MCFWLCPCEGQVCDEGVQTLRGVGEHVFVKYVADAEQQRRLILVRISNHSLLEQPQQLRQRRNPQHASGPCAQVKL